MAYSNEFFDFRFAIFDFVAGKSGRDRKSKI